MLLEITLMLALYSITLGQSNPICPKDWTYYAKTNKCFKAFGGAFDGVAPTTWSVAEEFCSGFNGGHLVAFHSDEEVQFVMGLAHQAQIHDDGGDAEIHIGLAFSTASNWFWQDASTVTYLKWFMGYGPGAAFGLPQPSETAGFLMTRRARTGYMWAHPGDDKFPFVCQATPVTEG